MIEDQIGVVYATFEGLPVEVNVVAYEDSPETSTVPSAWGTKGVKVVDFSLVLMGG